MNTTTSNHQHVAWWAFRTALFASAASLAVYIGYKYATQLHALEGFYAFLFPLSSVLALAGIILAVKPMSACGCGVGIRAGVGAVGVLWLCTGLMCVPHLMEWVVKSPASGMFAVFHLLTQHVFLSLSLVAFAFAPQAMLAKFGITAPVSKVSGDIARTNQTATN